MSTARRIDTRKAARYLALLIVPALVAACASGYQYRQPKVSVADSREDVAFAPGSAALSPAAAAELGEFIASTRPSAGGGDMRVFVVGAASVVGAPDQTARLIDRRNRAVADILAANGIVAEPVPAEVDRPVRFRRIRWRWSSVARVVTLPACPDWSAWPNYSNFYNLPYSDWSCATAVNFGMMVADPSDLVRGRTPGDADGTVMARTIDNYRKGKTKPIMRDVSAPPRPIPVAAAADRTAAAPRIRTQPSCRPDPLPSPQPRTPSRSPASSPTR